MVRQNSNKENRWGWFPSAALAWKVSNENFLKDNDVINNLKLVLVGELLVIRM